MPQSTDKILDHELLFREPEYKALFQNKKEKFEFKDSEEAIKEFAEWTKTEDYKEKNFARESLTVNPAKRVSLLEPCLWQTASTRHYHSCMALRAAWHITAHISRGISRSRLRA